MSKNSKITVFKKSNWYGRNKEILPLICIACGKEIKDGEKYESQLKRGCNTIRFCCDCFKKNVLIYQPHVHKQRNPRGLNPRIKR